jgi:hypothetical protein
MTLLLLQSLLLGILLCEYWWHLRTITGVRACIHCESRFWSRKGRNVASRIRRRARRRAKREPRRASRRRHRRGYGRAGGEIGNGVIVWNMERNTPRRGSIRWNWKCWATRRCYARRELMALRRTSTILSTVFSTLPSSATRVKPSRFTFLKHAGRNRRRKGCWRVECQVRC